MFNVHLRLLGELQGAPPDVKEAWQNAATILRRYGNPILGLGN